MDKSQVLARVQQLGLLAVIRGPSPEVTIKMVEALVAGGVLGIEITYTTPQAADVVQQLREQFGEDILVGMGTCTQPEHPAEALKAGAQFLVSPHTEPELAAAMRETGLLMMMGALTPTEVQTSLNLGSDVVKVFPGSLGGASYMRALKGPFPDVPMMPTGGVSQANLKDWFQAGAVAVGAGSKLCPKELALEGRFEEITAIAKDFVSAVEQAREVS